jgi:hypothetical protein
MFSLFWDQPVYRSIYAYNPFDLQRNRNRRSRYLNYLENRLANLINDEFEGLEDFWEDSTPRPVEHRESRPDAASESRESAPVPQVRKSQFSLHSSSRINGQDCIEEHREKFVGEGGDVHVRTRQRLGDRWHETETHTDAQGKNTERETWHNVGDDQIEAFKTEWDQKHKPTPQQLPQPEKQAELQHSAAPDSK